MGRARLQGARHMLQLQSHEELRVREVSPPHRSGTLDYRHAAERIALQHRLCPRIGLRLAGHHKPAPEQGLYLRIRHLKRREGASGETHHEGLPTVSVAAKTSGKSWRKPSLSPSPLCGRGLG